MKKIFLILVLLPIIAFAQEDWRLGFSVEAPGTTIFVRAFGAADGATDGYDILHDLPLIVSSSDTTVFFPVAGTFVTALSVDVRNNRTSGHEWELVFQNMPLSTATWLTDSVPSDGDFELSVHHVDSLPIAWIDMRTTPLVVVPMGYNIAFRWTVPAGDDTIPPYVSAWSPADGAIDVPRETDIYCEVRDDGTGVDRESIQLIINGIDYSWLVVTDSFAGGYAVNYDPVLDFGWDSDVTCILSAYDLETPSNYVSDTVVWHTLPDSLAFEVAGTVSIGDPLMPLAGAIVTISDKADTTGTDGYFRFDSISEGTYTMRAGAPGYSQETQWVWIVSDTIFNFVLETSPPPDVLIIDYDSGSRPFVGDTTGEERKIADLLDFLGYTYEITEQNPDISSLDLVPYTFVVFVTAVRESTAHSVVPDAGLSILASWLDDDGRILWIAPDGGPDYAGGTATGTSFFNMFGAVYESYGRAAEPDGNIARLYGDASDFWLDMEVEYALNSAADNYLDEFTVTETTAYVAAWSQDTLPGPLAATGRMVFYDSGSYRSAITSFLFGGIIDDIFPNSASNVLRAAMSYLDKPSTIGENRKIPEATKLRVYPNPFNSTCSIEAREDIEIYDVSGRLVYAMPVKKSSNVVWAGRDDNGADLPSGIYLIRETNSGRSASIVLLK